MEDELPPILEVDLTHIEKILKEGATTDGAILRFQLSGGEWRIIELSRGGKNIIEASAKCVEEALCYIDFALEIGLSSEQLRDRIPKYIEGTCLFTGITSKLDRKEFMAWWDPTVPRFLVRYSWETIRYHQGQTLWQALANAGANKEPLKTPPQKPITA